MKGQLAASPPFCFECCLFWNVGDGGGVLGWGRDLTGQPYGLWQWAQVYRHEMRVRGGIPFLLLFVRVGEVDNLVRTVIWQIVNSLCYRLNRNFISKMQIALSQNQFILLQDLQI